MNIVWLILKILGLTLAGVLALILIALLIPAVVEISYRQKKLEVALRFLFLRFRLIKADAIKLEKEDGLEVDLKTEGKKGKKKEEKIKLDVNMILALLKPGGRAVWYITRRLRVYDICIRSVTRGEDCAAAGIKTGQRWAMIGMLCAAVNAVWPRARYTELTVIPDFTGEYTGGEKYSCNIAALPIIIVIAGIGFLIKYITVINERQKEKIEHEAQATVDVETT